MLRRVLAYAQGVVSGKIVANKERIQCACGFLNDIRIREMGYTDEGCGFCNRHHRENVQASDKDETLDGTPLRGKPFLEPWRSLLYMAS